MTAQSQKLAKALLDYYLLGKPNHLVGCDCIRCHTWDGMEKTPESAFTELQAEIETPVIDAGNELVTKPGCVWSEDDGGTWASSCGNAFVFNCDGPVKNGFKFCPHCGKPLTEKPCDAKGE